MSTEPTDNFHEIYRTSAADYHRMISAEDSDHRIAAALRARLSLSPGQLLLDLGGGTGRVPLLLAVEKLRFASLDLHRGMLAEQRVQRDRLGGAWPLLQGDIRALPFPAASTDAAVAGWALGHFCGWFPDWRDQIEQALREMRRVVRPGGSLIILETLGTGVDEPAPPTPALAAYYHLLETRRQFTRDTLATDYQFASPEQAASRTAFFFGEQLASRIRSNSWSRVPEWTGLWHRTA